MVALAAFYCPGLWVIAHPRAAGFGVLAFSLLVAIVVLTWLRRSPGPPPGRLRWAVPAVIAVFALWANLHGGFVAGLGLIALVVAGLALERRLGGVEEIDPRRVVALAATGVLAAVTTMLATPFGDELLNCLASFRNSAISLVSSEWLPSFQSPLAIAYMALAASAGRARRLARTLLRRRVARDLRRPRRAPRRPRALRAPASYRCGDCRSPSRDRGPARARLRGAAQDPGGLLPRQAARADCPKRVSRKAPRRAPIARQ